MARNFGNLNMGMLAGLAGSFNMLSAAPKDEDSTPLHSLENNPLNKALQAVRNQTEQLARDAAHARVSHLNLPPEDPRTWPTMDDYIVASRTPEIRAMAATSEPPVKWDAKTSMDFSGRELKNFIINRDSLRTPKPVGFKANPQDAASPLPVYDAALRESLGMTDEEISSFYAEVNTSISFDSTKFYNVHFHPADTFDEYVRDRKVECHNVTFDGIDRAVHLENGVFNNIHFINIQQGEIVVGAEDAKGPALVDGMDIRSVRAKITLHGNAIVDHMEVDERTRILEMDMKPGATIKNAQLGDATITMNSKLQGITLENVEFKGTNLTNVDMQGATLNNVKLDKADLKGLNLKGATIHNLTVDGQPVDRAQLAALGVTLDETTRLDQQKSLHAHHQQQQERQPVAKAEAKPADPLAELGKAINSQNMATGGIAKAQVDTREAGNSYAAETRIADAVSTGNYAALSQLEQARDTARAPKEPAPSAIQIRFDGNADLNTITQTSAVAENSMNYAKAPEAKAQEESMAMLMARLSGKLSKA